MLAVLHSLGMFFVDLFKPRRRPEAENLFVRHQLAIALRRAPPRPRLCGTDRALLVWITKSSRYGSSTPRCRAATKRNAETSGMPVLADVFSASVRSCRARISAAALPSASALVAF